jgi:hypothetical protein
VIISLIMAAVFVGLLGDGPFSAATAGAEGTPLQIQYGRFARHRASVQMTIKLQPGAVPGDEARVWIDQGYLGGVELQNIIPEPDSVEAGPDRYVYVFKLSEPDAGAEFNFDLMPVRNGVRQVRVGLQGAQELQSTQIGPAITFMERRIECY